MVHQRAPRTNPPRPPNGLLQASPASPAFAVSSSSSAYHSVSQRPPPPRSSRLALQKPSLASRLVRSRITLTMLLFVSAVVLYAFFTTSASAQGRRESSPDPKSLLHHRQACPDYKDYSARRHPPYTASGIPFQRPAEECRLFKSDAVETLIWEMTSRMTDPDLARLFENAFPNTLDTTVRWHRDSANVADKQSFIVTGDINAQWLRDSTNQLSQYQLLVGKDVKLKNLILGAINTQVDFVLQSPYCNAFQPPKASGFKPTSNGQDDVVHPAYDNTIVFECKYEIDSLASFLSLGNQYFNHTSDTSFVTPRWLEAVKTVLTLIDQQTTSTFAPDGSVQNQVYKFQRKTTAGTETLNLGGIGNPINDNTTLVRSAFRPSDDAAIMQFFIPGNAFLSVELARTSEVLKSSKQPALAAKLLTKAREINAGVWKHGVVNHAVFGKVFAYEVDGYGSHIIMDDANLPSLLSLPLLGFVDVNDEIYQNTRRMILSQQGNPYFLTGSVFQGIGGPHIGITHAWPMSVLVQIMTMDDDAEIQRLLAMVLKASGSLGLIHESVNVERVSDYTRSWFAWANSVYAQTILDLAHRKPHLIFKTDANGVPGDVVSPASGAGTAGGGKAK